MADHLSIALTRTDGDTARAGTTPAQAAVSQIIIDLKLRGYVSHDRDPNWTREGRAWDAIVSRFMASPQPRSDKEGEDSVECSTCEGSGKIVEPARTEGINQHSACQRDCDDCDGIGRTPNPQQEGR